MPSPSPISKFASPSILLFLDQILLAAGGWLYWIMLSKVASVSNIGDATSVYNLVLLGSTVAMLGLEYPLLRRTSLERSRILGTTLVIELIVSLAAVPAILFVSSTYNEHVRPLGWMTALMFVLSSIGLVPRFALLGISNAKDVLIMHTVAIVVRFFVGYELVIAGYGSYGIIISFLFQFLIGTVGTLLIAMKNFPLKFGPRSYFKDLTKDALVNSPSKLSYLLIFNLSVVMLAAYGASSSDVGIFYVAVMISSVAGTLGSSMAFMAIPASSMTSIDHSFSSTRLSLGLTAPFVAALVVAPKTILTLVGSQYGSGDIALAILSLGVLPYVMTLNSISKFNYLKKSKNLIVIGSVQIIAFVLAFYLLMPVYGTIGAALSVTIAFLASALVSLLWTGWELAKPFGTTSVAMAGGIAGGYVIQFLLGGFAFHNVIAILAALGVSTAIVLASRNVVPNEIRIVVQAFLKRERQT